MNLSESQTQTVTSGSFQDSNVSLFVLFSPYKHVKLSLIIFTDQCNHLVNSHQQQLCLYKWMIDIVFIPKYACKSLTEPVSSFTDLFSLITHKLREYHVKIRVKGDSYKKL